MEEKLLIFLPFQGPLAAPKCFISNKHFFVFSLFLIFSVPQRLRNKNLPTITLLMQNYKT